MSSACPRILHAAVVSMAMVSSCCATRATPASGAAPVRDDFGIPACPAAASATLLSADALQCWFAAPHGRWRRLNHQSHLEALVVEVEADDLRDAVSIAQRLVEDPMAGEFAEILVYVSRPEGGTLNIRRVRWRRGDGYDTLDFCGDAADTPLTIRSSPGSAPDAAQPKR